MNKQQLETFNLGYVIARPKRNVKLVITTPRIHYPCWKCNTDVFREKCIRHTYGTAFFYFECFKCYVESEELEG